MLDCTVQVYKITDTGRQRDHNEDFIAFFDPSDPEVLRTSGRLYIVADGVGGEAAGEVASEYAAKQVQYKYYQSTEGDLGDRLSNAIVDSNRDIYEYSQQTPEIVRMGTTIVAAAIRGRDIVVANVGDSRAYLIREDEIHQITRDHSLVARLVEEGNLPADEARNHPKRNVLLRSLGMDSVVHPDIYEGTVQLGDRFLLCSDGLTEYLSDQEIVSVITDMPVDQAARHLVRMANARGGKDNISVILLSVTASDSDSRQRSSTFHQTTRAPTIEEITDAAQRRTGRETPKWLRWLRDHVL